MNAILIDGPFHGEEREVLQGLQFLNEEGPTAGDWNLYQLVGQTHYDTQVYAYRGPVLPE